jgi:hypothetical protein
MARLESRAILGYLEIDPKHYEALISLVAPATPATRYLDPFAGEGKFLAASAQAWNVTPYANELDEQRALQCIERFGAKQAVQCDVERLRASNGAFGIIWANPPYDHDKTSEGSKRVEFQYLRHVWKWGAEGAIIMWCIYRQHITEEAAAFLAKNSHQVNVWALPGKHLGEYDQIVVVAIKGNQLNPNTLYQHILQQKQQPRVLAVQGEPLYRMPPVVRTGKFVFAPDVIDPQQGLRLIEEHGAWQSHGFQALLEIPPQPSPLEPVVAPRPGHMALVLAGGVANGAVIDTSEYGRAAVRSKIEQVEQIARVESEPDPNDPDKHIKKTTIRLKPTTKLTLLSRDGTLVEMEGDDALLNFITTNRKALAAYLNDRFTPMYEFDFANIGRWLSKIRLKGKYELYTAQKHVVGAIARGFQSRDSILLVGSMGSGKTAMGGTAAIAIASGVVEALRQQVQENQVVLIVAPPHLLEKWKRELYSITSNIFVQRLDRHEDVKAFMDKSAKLGAGIAKIGLIKRDLTKLGAGRDVAVIWHDEPIALWRHDQPTPEGYEGQPRIIKKRVPKCPCCGYTVMRETKGTAVPASEDWLKRGKRSCSICQTPLWQEARDKGSQPKPGEKYPRKNPRYRIDEYIQRKYPDRVFLLVWDEVHECQSTDTGNGEAFGRLAGVAKKVLGMTGTPFNGRSSSLFNLEYHLNERIRHNYPWGGAPRLSSKDRASNGWQSILENDSLLKGRSESRWVESMGVRERVLEERPTYDSTTGAYTGTSTYEKPYEEAPGISPLLVAEVLDHTIFFGLGDLGKELPDYEEIAMPVEMDADTYAEYDRTRSLLKAYLIQRRWEGDQTFRGSYLQWAMGWTNAAFRPTEVIHNLKHPISGEKRPHVVTKIPSYGENRIYAKEQALIDLLTDELANNRPCVVYLRQTGTRDIQPRIEKLIREHVPLAKPFVLKNTVAAERREAVIEQEVLKGTNIIICNPELVRTGLDLVFAPTLIYFELTFNLSTMMQAAARSYRLNQTHPLCKTIYMYYVGTMEETAVHLMSRKQRAAKLLTGDIGLTGLDSLTEGEGSFEQALMDAIGKEESLLDASQLFKTNAEQSAIDTEDAAFWNVEMATDEAPNYEADPLAAFAVAELGAGVQTNLLSLLPVSAVQLKTSDVNTFSTVRAYLKTIALPEDKFARIAARIVQALEDDVPNPAEDVQHFDFATNPAHDESLTRWLTKYLRSEKVVSRELCETVALEIVRLVQQPTSSKPAPKLHILPKPKTVRRRKPDLMAIPDDTPQASPSTSAMQLEDDDTPKQLAMF